MAIVFHFLAGHNPLSLNHKDQRTGSEIFSSPRFLNPATQPFISKWGKMWLVLLPTYSHCRFKCKFIEKHYQMDTIVISFNDEWLQKYTMRTSLYFVGPPFASTPADNPMDFSQADFWLLTTSWLVPQSLPLQHILGLIPQHHDGDAGDLQLQPGKPGSLKLGTSGPFCLARTVWKKS